jgi:hypothetical protein
VKSGCKRKKLFLSKSEAPDGYPQVAQTCCCCSYVSHHGFVIISLNVIDDLNFKPSHAEGREHFTIEDSKETSVSITIKNHCHLRG